MSNLVKDEEKIKKQGWRKHFDSGVSLPYLIIFGLLFAILVVQGLQINKANDRVTALKLLVMKSNSENAKNFDLLSGYEKFTSGEVVSNFMSTYMTDADNYKRAFNELEERLSAVEGGGVRVNTSKDWSEKQIRIIASGVYKYYHERLADKSGLPEFSTFKDRKVR